MTERPDTNGRLDRTVHCESCGQPCAADDAWTVRGRGKCCRIASPLTIEESARLIMARRIEREGRS